MSDAKPSSQSLETPLHVVGAAIVRDGKIMAARRGESIDLSGQWEFPGGKVEPDETPEACLTRELREELGIDIEVGAFLATGVVGSPSGRPIKLDVYRCTWVGGEMVLREHSEVAWLLPKELGDYDWAEADWPAVVALGGHPRT